jgi:hypothetical protein
MTQVGDLIWKQFKQLRLIKFVENKSLPILFFLMVFIVVFGHSITMPIRGQIAFGTNFLSEDGTRYAITMLEMNGKNYDEACSMVEKKFSQLAKFIEKPEYNVCYQPNDKVYSHLYGPRVVFPSLAALIYPLTGINSILWIPILIFFLIMVYQFRLAKYLNFSPPAILLSTFIALGSKHFIQLSLSTAATDLILSLLVFLLFFVLVHNLKNSILFITIIFIIILSTFNRQNQFFWIFFSLVIIVLTKILHLVERRKLYLASGLILLLQIPSIYITEHFWNSFSIAKQSQLFPVVNEPSNFLINFTRIAAKILITDGATIITKNLSTLVLFLTPVVLFIFLNSSTNNFEKNKLNVKFMFVFLIAVLSGCFANSMIQAVGNTYLRMYLPFMTVSTIPLMYLCDRFIFKKSQNL